MNNNFELIPTSNNILESHNFYIVFVLKNKKYAISINNIVEIINIPDIELDRNVPDNIIGIFNYNGQMINVVDLYSILNLEHENFSINNKLIITKLDDKYMALHINKVENINQFEDENIQLMPYSLENTIINNIYKSQDDTIDIIDIKLIEKILDNTNKKTSTVDYSLLLPKDEKSKQILEIRAKQIKGSQSSEKFSYNENLIQQYLLFTLGDFYYYVDLKYIREFISAKRLKITHLPYTPSYIKGIANIKGKFLVVLDLKKFLNKNLENVQSGDKLIIIESKNFDIAILVDDIKYIKDLKNINKTLRNSYSSPFIQAEFTEENQLYSILNLEKILNDDSLYINIV